MFVAKKHNVPILKILHHQHFDDIKIGILYLFDIIPYDIHEIKNAEVDISKIKYQVYTYIAQLKYTFNYFSNKIFSA